MKKPNHNCQIRTCSRQPKKPPKPREPVRRELKAGFLLSISTLPFPGFDVRQETRWGRCMAPWCRQLALQPALGSRGWGKQTFGDFTAWVFQLMRCNIEALLGFFVKHFMTWSFSSKSKLAGPFLVCSAKKGCRFKKDWPETYESRSKLPFTAFSPGGSCCATIPKIDRGRPKL